MHTGNAAAELLTLGMFLAVEGLPLLLGAYVEHRAGRREERETRE